MEFELSDSQELYDFLRDQDYQGIEGIPSSIIGDSDGSHRYLIDDCVAHDLASKITRETGRSSFELDHREDWTHIIGLIDKAVIEDKAEIILPEDFDEKVMYHHRTSNHGEVDAAGEAYQRTIDFLDKYSEKVDLESYVPGLEIAEADIGERDSRLAMAALGEATLITYDRDFAELPVNTETPLNALYELR